MTKGDKIKLRAELAGKAMQGILTNPDSVGWAADDIARDSVHHADALMAKLGISMEDEK